MPIDCVDDHDAVIGVINRRDLPVKRANFRVAHVFVFNSRGELLLQRIAAGQRSPGLLGSSVAGYVLAGESYLAAAQRKFVAELGIPAPELRLVGRTHMPDLGGRKFISLFVASADGPFTADSQQIAELRFIPVVDLQARVNADPDSFTPTFRHVFPFFVSRARQ